MIRATLDLGTNTCLLLIVQWAERNAKENQVAKVLGDYSTIVRLGEGVDRKRELQEAPMQRVLECLRDYALKLKAFKISPKDALCVATSQARDARNSSVFFDKIKSELGFEFQILTGLDEAKYTFLGALLPGMIPDESLVIDIGGGSTEIITSHEGESVDIGSVRLTERFFKSDPVTDAEFWACQDFVDHSLEGFVKQKEKLSKGRRNVVAVAGTATTLAAWHLGLQTFDQDKINSALLTRGEVHRMMEELKWRTLEERRQIPLMERGRADIILAGSMILWRTMELLGFQECRISTRGLRYGVLRKPSQ